MSSSRTVPRQTATRRTPRPRKSSPAGSFTGMLAKLGFATSTVRATRGRR